MYVSTLYAIKVLVPLAAGQTEYVTPAAKKYRFKVVIAQINVGI